MAGTELETNTASEETLKQDSKATPVRERRWRVGSRLEARTEEEGEQWFQAKVQEVDKEKRQVLVHYMQWNSRHDEWVASNSPRLRPLRSSARLDTNTNTNGTASTPLPTTPPNNVASIELAKDFKVGDKVMAHWKLKRKFPATVKSFDPETGNYLVEFYDQVESIVRPNQIRKMKEDEEHNHLNTNGDIRTDYDNETNDENIGSKTPNAEETAAKPITPKGRRERKRKFDVKTLLNLRPTSAASSVPSSPSSPIAASTKMTTVTPSTNKKATDEMTPKTATTPIDTKKARSRKSDRQNKTDDDKVTPTPKVTNNITEAKNDADSTMLAAAAAAAEVVSGKRERKRKKFWDEQEPEIAGTPAMKPAKKQSQGNHQQQQKVKHKRRQSINVVSNDVSAVNSVSHKDVSSVQTTNASTESNPAKENGKLKYLMFDLTLDPRLIAEKMIEGVNIPGPGVPIPIDSSRLPNGWEKRVIQRGIGITKGKWDVFIQNPNGRSFRSKTELQRHLDEMKSPHTADEFDFSLDDRLKKLRQIWKQFIVNAGTDKESRKSSKKSLNADSTAVNSENSPIKEKVSKKKQSAAVVAAATATVATTPAVESMAEPTPDALAILRNICVESETGQGLRCKIAKCGKLFRNDRLLHQHVKHYHPEFFDQVIKSFSTPATSPPSAMVNNVSTCLSHTPSVDLSIPDSLNLSQIREESKKRKSLCIDSTPSLELAMPKKRKLSLGFDEEDLARPTKKLIRALDRSRELIKRPRPNKKFSFSESSSPCNNNDVFDQVANVGRTRNDSVLSIGSGSVAPSEDGDHDNVAMASSKSSRNLPPTPPTFRLSKRRQAQLLDSDKKFSRRRTCLGLGRGDEASFRGPLSPPEGIMPSTSGYYPFSSNPSSSYPPSEVDTSVTSEHLTSEEVVNCECRRKEEDGLMIQCDICLCWQHGICLGIDDEEQVPDKHICETCRNPVAGRSSAKYNIDHDWLKEGKLPTINAVKVESNCSGDCAFKKLSELMADLANLNKVLHSLRVKLQVASQTNNTKVFMWSMLWDDPLSIQQQQNASETTLFENAFIPETDSNFGGKFDAQAVIDKLKFRLSEAVTAAGGDPFTKVPQTFPNNSSDFCSQTQHQQQQFLSNHLSDSHRPNNDSNLDDASHDLMPAFLQNMDAINQSSTATTTTSLSAGETDGPCNPSTDSPQMSPETSARTSNNKENEPITRNGDVLTPFEPEPKKPNDEDQKSETDLVSEVDLQLESEHLETDTTSFDPCLIPTISEVAQLLPSVIEAMGSAAGTDHDSPLPILSAPPPPRVLIQEPKRLDRDECRLNLLDHISSVQAELELRLDSIEMSLNKIVEDDVNDPLPATISTRSMLTTVLRDLSTARTLLWSLK